MPETPHDPSVGASVGPGARFLGAVFGVVFAGIGLSVLGFMWLTPREEFGAPPLFFRIFASLIAIPFVAIGGTLAYGAIRGKTLASHAQERIARLHGRGTGNAAAPTPGSSGATYRCPRCGAPLGKEADVSPSGDVKCTFCNAWFNVHRPTA